MWSESVSNGPDVFAPNILPDKMIFWRAGKFANSEGNIVIELEDKLIDKSDWKVWELFIASKTILSDWEVIPKL